MGSGFQIRNVPEETHRILKARAAARRKSLNTYLLEILEREVARPTLGEILDRAAREAVLAEAAEAAEAAERAGAAAVEALDEA
ncbi:hypothetical protein D6T64_11610 [Cryobacterium melibiosiphilum]|uniref:Antitoxin FitA-like ribbon-helix-helix domain-containing protein n=2 Tax=Cryobacterium melibiosiphilum TaxID=995039 RepID=A0A3A5MFF4_9MICO|nr:hypothetical protein D6T64_11610 [Cryobacterium melibiosiphilum]